MPYANWHNVQMDVVNLKNLVALHMFIFLLSYIINWIQSLMDAFSWDMEKLKVYDKTKKIVIFQKDIVHL